jgi:predicted SnoaL-like aldol condensation-catalyzing enzyme
MRMTSVKEGLTSAKVLYSRWIGELWAGEPVANELVSDDFVGHWPDLDVHGPDELSALVDKMLTVLSDMRFMIEVEPFGDGNFLAVRWIGTWAMPDGPKRFTGNDIFRIADGRFVEYWTGTTEG